MDNCYTGLYWFLHTAFCILLNQSHTHTYIYVCICMFIYPLPLEPSSILPHPASRLWPGAGWAPCATRQCPTSWLFHTWWCMYVSAAFSAHPTLSFPHCGRVPGWLPVPHGCGPLVACVTHGGACMSILHPGEQSQISHKFEIGTSQSGGSWDKCTNAKAKVSKGSFLWEWPVGMGAFT